ncbi:hypothetical protein TIFTF001_021962 [Ficus carica]|uniref:Uncharacterized protein n=1 Tax=Ficus carica TaxID=3494 RepID=A0AA88ABK9_FICCA|nr:hypothetical protein TIFTF001_021962 [Ficus carica]
MRAVSDFWRRICWGEGGGGREWRGREGRAKERDDLSVSDIGSGGGGGGRERRSGSDLWEMGREGRGEREKRNIFLEKAQNVLLMLSF